MIFAVVATEADIGGALEQEALTWTVEGNPNAITQVVSSEFADGDAIRFERIGEEREVNLSTTITGPARISFRWRLLETEDSCVIRFDVNGLEQAYLNSSSAWQNESFVYSSEDAIELVWSYFDGSDGDFHGNAAWLDSITISNGPIIEVQPQTTYAKQGSSVTLEVRATETTPNTYQWSKDGVEILGATESTFAIENASTENEGSYTVEITNADGSVISEPVSLTTYQNLGESVEQPEWNWETSGNANWFPQAEVTIDGEDALAYRSVEIRHTASVETTVTGTGELSFWRRFDWINSYNGSFDFYLDGQRMELFQTPWEWRKSTYHITTPGEHTLSWRLEAGSSAFNSTRHPAAAWIDQVQFQDKPIIVAQPENRVINVGEMLELSVEAVSQSPLSYTWRKDGVEIQSGENPSLTIDLASVDDSGAYDVVVSNSEFETLSSSAEVYVITPVGEALNQSELTWTLGGDRPWVPQSDVTLNDDTALEIGPRNHEGSAWLETSIEGPVTVSFWWKGEALSCCTNVSFLVDDQTEAYLPETDWEQVRIEIPNPGPHTLRWLYEQSFYTEFRNATAWLDQIEFEFVPIITKQPRDSSVREGADFTFEVEAVSTEPLAFQWFKDGTEISGANESTLSLSNVAVADQASYHVVVSNESGSVQSDSAILSSYGNFGDSIEQPELEWAFGDSSQWFVQSDSTIDGIDAAKCVIPISDDFESNWMETSIAGPFQLSFWWRVDAERFATSTLEINGSSVAEITAAQGEWRKVEVATEFEGDHTIRFTFDGSFEEHKLLYIDQIAISRKPVITEQPLSGVLIEGDELTLSVAASSETPLEYQWLKNGIEIPGETSNTLNVAAVSLGDAGTFLVKATNESGSVYSDTSQIRITEDYGQTLGQPDLNWVASEGNSWFSQSAISADGSPALEAQAIEYLDPIVWIETTIEGPAQISFLWKLVEEDRPNFSIYIDGVRRHVFWESTGWQPYTFDLLESGPHTVRWEFDASDSNQLERVWIDNIQVSRAPIVTLQPFATIAKIGESLSLTIEAISDSAISYQWRKDGIEIPGQTSPVLEIASLVESDFGSYEVVLSNEHGSSISLPALVASSNSINEALESPDLSWALEGNGEIELQNVHTSDGVDALRLATHHTLSLTTEIEGPSILEFWWKSEGVPATQFRFRDGSATRYFSGNDDSDHGAWIRVEIPFTETGPHNIDWLLDLGNDPAEHASSFFLDQVKVSPIADPPLILIHPRPGVLSSNSPYTLSVLTNGDASTNYQWRKDGVDIPGADSETYLISDPMEQDEGLYDVVISNEQDAVISRSAQLIWSGAIRSALNLETESFEFGGNGTISIEEELGYDGDSAVKVEVEPGGSVWLNALSASPSDISFWWKSESSDCNPYAGFFENSQFSGNIDAGQDWVKVERLDHAFVSYSYLWKFTADDDCSAVFYLDQITIEPNQIITRQPTVLAGYMGDPLNIYIEVLDTEKPTYQWLKDGSPIVGATGRNLHIGSPQESDAGIYQLELQTPSGLLYSDPISVAVYQNIGGPIEAEELPWTTGESGSWSLVSEDAWDGEDALRMFSGHDWDLPRIDTVVNGPATISFQWWVGLSSGDEIRFFIDGEVARIYNNDIGNEGWKEETFELKASGPHTLTWGLIERNDEAPSIAMLDNLTVTQTPIIESSTGSRSFVSGQSTVLEASSPSPNTSYQWMKDGALITGATEPTLTVTLPGTYELIATNEFGSSTKEIATIEWIDSIGHLIEQPNLPWVMPIDGKWIESLENFDGEDALRSPDFPIGGQTYLSTQIEGPTSLSFDYSMLGSRMYAYLQIGEVGMELPFSQREWKRFSYSIEEEGPHEFSLFVFVEEPLDFRGNIDPYTFSPRIRLDNLSVSKTPKFSEFPESDTLLSNDPLSLISQTIGLTSEGLVNYQWYKDGIAIPDATNSTFYNDGVQESDTGEYYVVASNEAGESASRTASILVLENLDATVPEWTSPIFPSGTTPWEPVVVNRPEFSMAMTANVQPEDQWPQISILDTVVEGPGTLSFYWRANVNRRSSFFKFEIDDAEVINVERSQTWRKSSFYLSEGFHRLRWVFETNRDARADAWLADLKLDQLPFIDPPGGAITVFAGSELMIPTQVTSSTPSTQQWFFNEVAIEAGTQPSLVLPNIQVSDTGTYRLEATNEFGTRQGLNWNIEVLEAPAIVLGQNDITFSFSGDGNWKTLSNSPTRLVSPLLDPGQESSASVRIIGPATVQFDFAVFFDNLGNRFEFYVDDQLISTFDRTSLMGPYHYRIDEPGEHVLTWRMVMNEFDTTGGRTLHIENLRITTDIQSVYNEWAQLVFPSNTTELERDLREDPDYDNKPNILEYLVGSDPLFPDPPIQLESIENEGQRHWQTELELFAWIEGIEFSLEISSDLKSWLPLETEFRLEEIGNRVLMHLQSVDHNDAFPPEFVRVKLQYDSTKL